MDGRLVLVAGDDADLRDLLKVALERAAGVQAVAARGELETLRLVREVRPGLILLDPALGHNAGCLVLRLLKSDPATRSIPVIGVSCRPRVEALRAGCDDHIGLPFGLGSLVTKVLQHLPRHVPAGT